MKRKLKQKFRKFKHIKSIKPRRTLITLGLAVAGLGAMKTTIQQQKMEAAEAAWVAKAKKKNIIQANIDDEDDIDLENDEDFYRAILLALGVNETAEKLKFLRAWRQGEGGEAKNNPFNTSKHIPGTVDTKYNSHGVRNYPNRKIGLDATVATLRLAHYKEIVDMLKDDTITAMELARSAALKKWGTGPMVMKVLKGGRVNPPPIA